MGKLTGISILITIFSIILLLSLFTRLYLPTRDKLILAEQKITSYEKQIETYRHAEIQTARTIKKLKDNQDKEARDWSNIAIPASVLNILQDTHRAATSRYAPSDRVSNIHED